jgi:hypothetical protein
MNTVKGLTLWVMVIFALAATVSAAVRCDVCGKEISGKYVTGPDNTHYCRDCYSKYPACSGCGKIVKSLISVGDLKFCRDCYNKLEKCDFCGDPLTGSYTIYPELGINLCPQCEAGASRCRACNRPAKKLNRVGDTYLCDLCAAKADRCYSCGDALLSDYKFFEGDQTKKYCSRCVDQYQKCADCGAPSGPRGTKLDDGRYLCPACRSLAIFDPALVTPVKLDVLRYMSAAMKMDIKHNINYTVQDKNFLLEKSKDYNQDINGLFYRKGADYNIYVLYGLRKKDLFWVLAHEITHAWQAENCPEDLDSEDREGFAQWIAYHATINFGYGDYAENMRNGDSMYSRSLNKMIGLEKKGGPGAVFDYITKKDFKKAKGKAARDND